MTTPSNTVPFSWKVIGVESGQYGPGPNATDVPGKIVTFQLGNGSKDDVFVPSSSWGTEQARTIIQRAAQTAYDVLTMTGGGAA